MIVILKDVEQYECSYITDIYEVKINNPEQAYKDYMVNQALLQFNNLVINPHWLNAMNYEDHNNHLSLSEYCDIVDRWEKFLSEHSFSWYIINGLGGKKLKYVESYF